MYCELDENKILMGYSDQPSTVSIEINKPIPVFTSTQRVKWNGSDWVVEDVQALIDEKTEWEAQDYARKRAAEYPSIAELTVALYDTDDKAAIDAKRAAVKAKYPKPS